jgi:hypothetical protein
VCSFGTSALNPRERAFSALTSLCRGKPLIILTRMRNNLNTVLKSTIQSVGEGNGEARNQKVDIKLQVPLRIQTVNHQGSAVAIGGAHQIER